MRSAFGAGSLDGAALESVELGAVELGAALESLDEGVLLDGMVVLLGGVLEVDGEVLGSGVVAPGPDVGFCVCSLCGAPCAEGVELLSVVWAYAKLIAPTIVAAATAVVNVFDAVMSILLDGQSP